MKSRQRCYANEEIGANAVAFPHLGLVAMQLGRKLKFDPKANGFLDDDEANKMLVRQLREPWTLEKALA